MDGGGGNVVTAGAPASNGIDNSSGHQQPLNQIKQALEIVYDPHSTNDSRKQAGLFLESAKSEKEAPYHGFTLAYDRGQNAVVRHFGLLLLEHALKYHWDEYSVEESTTVRNWILSLAENVKMDGGDPVYLRNKIAQLWVEVAKRSWANEWLDMDELLAKLWENSSREGNPAQRDLVLSILESLVEDVFNREDSVAGIRNTPLSKACIDIFTPMAVLREHFPLRDPSVVLVSGEEGWLARLVGMLEQCLEAGVQGNSEVEACAIKVLGTLKACMAWAIPKAIAAAKVVETVGRSLMVETIAVQMVATECLHTLFTRILIEDDDFQKIVCPMYHAQTVDLLRKIFNWIQVDPNNIDEEPYLFLKRFSEMVANLASFVEEKANLMLPETDLSEFMKLLFEITSHNSLAVSIPVLNVWTRIVKKDILSEHEAVLPLIPGLLELVTSRLMRYEVMEDDSNPILLFLNEDLDTIPERHAFLGNYRRFCQSIVESMVRKRPFEAFPYIMSQAENSLTGIYSRSPSVNLEEYCKNSNAFLELDAQFTVMEAALKGYIRWADGVTNNPSASQTNYNTNRDELEQRLEGWCERVLNMNFEDPMIRRRVIQLMVTVSTSALHKKADLMLKILEHVLLTRPVEHPNHAYTDAVKELMSVCTTEIQRLAMKMPDHLMLVYDQLQTKINEIVATENVDDRTRIAFHTFLFTINHRTKNIDPQLRQSRLEGYIFPVREAWRDPVLTESLQTFQGFCQVLGLDKVQDYLVSRRVNEISDFTKQPLDEEGQALQLELTEKFKNLPIRTTKAFLAVSTEQLRKPSNAYNISCALWHDSIPMILPNLLKFLSHAHAFHNPATWQGLQPELQSVIRKILTDRFWQAGISTGSRDEFYENVTKTKTTMEGLASSIRGAIRMVREACYSILWCMSRVDVHFYGLNELPGPLALALFADAHALSSHQMSILLNMTRYIIDDCPTTLRAHFLTPLLASLFAQVDRKISGEWDELMQKGQITQDDDKLAEEMKEESILRQLTYTAVLIVAGLLDPQRPGEAVNANPGFLSQVAAPESQSVGPGEQIMREFILSMDSVLEPLILFCTHALRMRDSRCCGIIIRVFRSIVPEFQADRPDIREFICREVLMAAIDSLHEDYFVDVQKDLAQLIATIFLLYSPTSLTPRNLLLSLPGITEYKVDSCYKKLTVATSTRQQRALILELLDGLRGVAVSEKGKLLKSAPAVKQRTQAERKQQMQYAEKRQESPDLGGVADMFA
ncbi:uncharacterized protein H6S33_012881 [Morchella sextelata]|uniref:uncharacterized protein n=1 Tax=Morchella sextelata TaxID=1174677 RepID=UPI001D04F440|nr:uncharacterized protein H6S33_012881 [Morchella sextelata]KAH0609395.1 hypothetical protein H6S33_012881 [Morchella sextelata]